MIPRWWKVSLERSIFLGTRSLWGGTTLKVGLASTSPPLHFVSWSWPAFSSQAFHPGRFLKSRGKISLFSSEDFFIQVFCHGDRSLTNSWEIHHTAVHGWPWTTGNMRACEKRHNSLSRSSLLPCLETDFYFLLLLFPYLPTATLAMTLSLWATSRKPMDKQGKTCFWVLKSDHESSENFVPSAFVVNFAVGGTI